MLNQIKFVLVLLVSIHQCYGDYYEEQGKLEKHLFRRYDNKDKYNYNKNIKPEHKVNVALQIYIRRIDEISVLNGYMDYQLTFRQKWRDERLEYGDKFPHIDTFTLGQDYMKKIWMPDTFFRNEISSSTFENMTPNMYVRISPDGTVLFSQRLQMRSGCEPYIPPNTTFAEATAEMNKMNCDIQIASYGWRQEEVEYSWHERPFQIVNNLGYYRGFVPDFDNFGKTSTRTMQTATGNYSVANLNFKFKASLDPQGYCNY